MSIIPYNVSRKAPYALRDGRDFAKGRSGSNAKGRYVSKRQSYSGLSIGRILALWNLAEAHIRSYTMYMMQSPRFGERVDGHILWMLNSDMGRVGISDVARGVVRSGSPQSNEATDAMETQLTPIKELVASYQHYVGRFVGGVISQCTSRRRG